MSRIFLDNDKVTITLREDFLLDIQLPDEELLAGVSPRRLFPISSLDKYISFLDDSQKEIAVLKDISSLSADSQKAVIQALNQYYLVPKLIKFTSIEDRFGRIRVEAISNNGTCKFEIADRSNNLKVLRDGRILIRDTNDNRYEISDINSLDQKVVDVFLL